MSEKNQPGDQHRPIVDLKPGDEFFLEWFLYKLDLTTQATIDEFGLTPAQIKEQMVKGQSSITTSEFARFLQTLQPKVNQIIGPPRDYVSDSLQRRQLNQPTRYEQWKTEQTELKKKEEELKKNEEHD